MKSLLIFKLFCLWDEHHMFTAGRIIKKLLGCLECPFPTLLFSSNNFTYFISV